MDLRRAVAAAKKYADPKGALPGHAMVQLCGDRVLATDGMRGLRVLTDVGLNGVAVDAAALASTLGAISGPVTLTKRGRAVHVGGELGDVAVGVFYGHLFPHPEEPPEGAAWHSVVREDLDHLVALAGFTAGAGDSHALGELGSVRVSRRGFMASDARRSLYWATERFPLSEPLGIPPEFLQGAEEEGCRFTYADGAVWLVDADKAAWSRTYGSMASLSEETSFDVQVWRVLDGARAFGEVTWCRPAGDKFASVVEAAAKVLGGAQWLVLDVDPAGGRIGVTSGGPSTDDGRPRGVQGFTAEVPAEFRGGRPTRLGMSQTSLRDLVSAMRSLRGDAWAVGWHETSPTVFAADDGTLFGLAMPSRAS